MPEIKFVPARAEYAELWYNWRSQANYQKYNPIDKNSNIEVIRKRLKDSSSDLSQLSDREYIWFAEDQFSGKIVASASFRNINLTMKFGEIGYGVNQDFQNQGYATAVVSRLVQKIFKETELHKITAYVSEKNLASLRVLEKCAFQKEGLLREHYIINGQRENEVIFGLLRSDL